MEFTKFAETLKPIIGGSYSTHVFTRTLFESIITDDGLLQIEDISENTFKAYYNGQTNITKIAKRVLPHIEPEQFVLYLNSFPEATTQRLCDAFQTHIEDINMYNASEKIAYLLEEILKIAAAQKRKSTPRSAKKECDRTPHDIFNEKVLTSGRAIADVGSKTLSNLVSPTTSTDTLDENNLSPTDSAFLERFKSQVEPLLTYCIDHDPSGEGTKLSLADEIDEFLQSWNYDVRRIQNSCFRKLVIDTMNVLGDYTYYISDKFLRWIPDTDILWFRNESIEEGNQLREVLRPETIKKRTEMRDIYVRLYPIPEDNTDINALEIPSEQTTNESPYSLADNLLLQEFTTDYDEIMLSLIGENYAMALIDRTLPCRIKDLYDNKWISKADTFANPTLKSYVFGLLGELNTISNSFLDDRSDTSLLGSSRTKIRNLYVKLHPQQFAEAFPYDAFIDDWHDGEYY
jgi:hypothetical protein|nr:MAG TPA: hypothetical protein [Caudoviricetes sp.]